MRTNIEIDAELMREALKWSELKSKKEVVNEALMEFIKHLKRQKIKSLQGKVDWIGDRDKISTFNQKKDR